MLRVPVNFSIVFANSVRKNENYVRPCRDKSSVGVQLGELLRDRVRSIVFAKKVQFYIYFDIILRFSVSTNFLQRINLAPFCDGALYIDSILRFVVNCFFRTLEFKFFNYLHSYALKYRLHVLRYNRNWSFFEINIDRTSEIRIKWENTIGLKTSWKTMELQWNGTSETNKENFWIASVLQNVENLVKVSRMKENVSIIGQRIKICIEFGSIWLNFS